MKILIKNKKWNISLGDTVLFCDITEKDGTFYIDFILNNKIVKIKSKNIDSTLYKLEQIFLESQKKQVAL